MVVTEAYLQSLLAQITSQGGVPLAYPGRRDPRWEVDLNNVPTHSVSGFSRPAIERMLKGSIVPRNLFRQEIELMGARKEKQDLPRCSVQEWIIPF